MSPFLLLTNSSIDKYFVQKKPNLGKESGKFGYGPWIPLEFAILHYVSQHSWRGWVAEPFANGAGVSIGLFFGFSLDFQTNTLPL